MLGSSIVVIGARGFVGSALCEKISKIPSCELVKVSRENYREMQAGDYDILINCAMPSARFWAKNNPEADFMETVQKTEALFRGWKFKKFIQISTVSARTEPESVYGRHKREAEKICAGGDSLIVRLSAMHDKTLAKGVLVDILNGSKVFVSGQTRYPFASLDFISSWIAKNLNRTGLVEVGARNSLTLSEIAAHIKKKIDFDGPVENQEVQNPEPDFPDAREVLTFMEEMNRTYESRSR